MKRATPYLNFPGTAKEAFDFYRSVFGGEFTAVVSYSDMESPDGGDGAGADGDLIAHISLPLSSESTLMGSDVSGASAAQLTTGTNVQIHLEADSADEARRVFEAISAGGTVTMPLEPTSWSALFGACFDRYGVGWMVDFTGDVQFSAG